MCKCAGYEFCVCFTLRLPPVYSHKTQARQRKIPVEGHDKEKRSHDAREAAFKQDRGGGEGKKSRDEENKQIKSPDDEKNKMENVTKQEERQNKRKREEEGEGRLKRRCGGKGKTEKRDNLDEKEELAEAGQQRQKPPQDTVIHFPILEPRHRESIED